MTIEIVCSICYIIFRSPQPHFVGLWMNVISMGNRLMVGQWPLKPSILVRAQVPQPRKENCGAIFHVAKVVKYLQYDLQRK